MNKTSIIILFYVLVILFSISPVLLIPFMDSNYMQVGWVFLYFTIPIGLIILIAYTAYLVYKKIRSQKDIQN